MASGYLERFAQQGSLIPVIRYSEFFNLICNSVCCFYDGWWDIFLSHLPLNRKGIVFLIKQFMNILMIPWVTTAIVFKHFNLTLLNGFNLLNSLSSYLNLDSNFVTRLPISGYMVKEDLNIRVTSFRPASNKIMNIIVLEDKNSFL